MKQMIMMIAAILTAFALLLLLCGASASPPAHVGTWELDTENGSVGIGELYTLFGSSLRTYGARLNLRADGTMDYYIGLTGGAGAYTAEDDTLTATVRSYTEGRREILTLDLVSINGEPHLILHRNDGYFSYDLWWRKAK